MKKNYIKNSALALVFLTSCTSPSIIINSTNNQHSSSEQKNISISTNKIQRFDTKKSKELAENFDLSVKTDSKSPLSIDFELRNNSKDEQNNLVFSYHFPKNTTYSVNSLQLKINPVAETNGDQKRSENANENAQNENMRPSTDYELKVLDDHIEIKLLSISTNKKVKGQLQLILNSSARNGEGINHYFSLTQNDSTTYWKKSDILGIEPTQMLFKTTATDFYLTTYLETIGVQNYKIPTGNDLNTLLTTFQQYNDLSSLSQLNIARNTNDFLKQQGIDEVVTQVAGIYLASKLTNSPFNFAEGDYVDDSFLVTIAQTLNEIGQNPFQIKNTNQSVYQSIKQFGASALADSLGLGVITPQEKVSSLNYNDPKWEERRKNAENVLKNPEVAHNLVNAVDTFLGKHSDPGSNGKTSMGKNKEELIGILGGIIYDEAFRGIPAFVSVKDTIAGLSPVETRIPLTNIYPSIGVGAIKPTTLQETVCEFKPGCSIPVPSLREIANLLSDEKFSTTQILSVVYGKYLENNNNLGLALNSYHGGISTTADARSQQVQSIETRNLINLLLGLGVCPLPDTTINLPADSNHFTGTFYERFRDTPAQGFPNYSSSLTIKPSQGTFEFIFNHRYFGPIYTFEFTGVFDATKLNTYAETQFTISPTQCGSGNFNAGAFNFSPPLAYPTKTITGTVLRVQSSNGDKLIFKFPQTFNTERAMNANNCSQQFQRFLVFTNFEVNVPINCPISM